MPADKPRLIGILGGTFDPVHNGHLGLARQVYSLCGLAEVRLIPVQTPPHRESPQASPGQRLQMLQLAVQGEAGLRVDERELQRAGPSYTVDTLRSFTPEMDGQGLCLIMGVDAFLDLYTWHQWTSIFELAHVIVASRPGTQMHIQNPELEALYRDRKIQAPADLHNAAPGRILSLAIQERDISSTQLRSLIAQRQDTASMLPENVLSFIKKEGLYYRD